MHHVEYLDVDRMSHGFIVTIRHDVNKKGEPVETITHVVHLGTITQKDVDTLYSKYPIATRSTESGDIKSLK